MRAEAMPLPPAVTRGKAPVSPSPAVPADAAGALPPKWHALLSEGEYAATELHPCAAAAGVGPVHYVPLRDVAEQIRRADMLPRDPECRADAIRSWLDSYPAMPRRCTWREWCEGEVRRLTLAGLRARIQVVGSAADEQCAIVRIGR